MHPILSNSLKFLDKNSPAILTGLAIAGTVGTTVLAVKKTPAATRALNEYKTTLEEDEKAKVLDIVKICWPYYVPAAVTASATIACIIFSNTINSKRIAAVAGAYSIAQEAATKYQDKVIEIVGDKKDQEIRDEIAKDTLTTNSLDKNTVIMTDKGEQLCYDSLSGRYFNSDIETLRRIQNDLNQALLGDTWISLNELYAAMGLRGIKLGDQMGWVPDNLIEMNFSAQLADDGKPCIVISYETEPKTDYYRSI